MVCSMQPHGNHWRWRSNRTLMLLIATSLLLGRVGYFLSLDPRDPRLSTTIIFAKPRQPGYENLDLLDADVRVGGIDVGPFFQPLTYGCLGPPLFGHEHGYTHPRSHRRRFLTGTATGLLARGSSASTWLSQHLGLRQPIPNLSVLVNHTTPGSQMWRPPFRSRVPAIHCVRLTR